MTLPLLARYANILRYDRERGVVLLLDRHAYPGETTFVACGDVEALTRAIDTTLLPDGRAAAYAAGYGLALAARAWSGRPSDAQRAAIIQAGQQLIERRPYAAQIRQVVEQGLAHADAAILAGADAEAAVATVVQGQVGRADRVAERCGRIAAGLVDDGDRMITHGFAGPALIWMLYQACVEQGKQIRLYVTEAHPGLQGAHLTVSQAIEIGVPVELLADSAAGLGFADGMFSVYLAGAEQIALDGSVAGAIGTYQCAVLARQHAVPCYVLGYDGPDPALPTGAEIAGAAAGDAHIPRFDITPPDLISAIITNRGIYRPEMIARYLGDGEAPLDVIPLQES
jgi:methylthioribose-1-phosphate isomerase